MSMDREQREQGPRTESTIVTQIGMKRTERGQRVWRARGGSIEQKELKADVARAYSLVPFSCTCYFASSLPPNPLSSLQVKCWYHSPQFP